MDDRTSTKNHSAIEREDRSVCDTACGVAAFKRTTTKGTSTKQKARSQALASQMDQYREVGYYPPICVGAIPD